MLLQLLLFFTLALAFTTIAILPARSASAPIWRTLPVGLGALAAAGWSVAVITQDRLAGELAGAMGVGVTLVCWDGLRRWSWLAAQMLAMLVLASLCYLAYAAWASYAVGADPVTVAGSTLLILLEAAALALSGSYAFEILDVLGRRPRRRAGPTKTEWLDSGHTADPEHQPWVAIQVPTYNEPVEVVADTLHSLAALDYPHLIIQVVDNNTPDPATWRPLEALCGELGSRFTFIHLENWPGFKAGALNEATKRLPDKVEVVSIVDADYTVAREFLRATVGHFADPQVAFVQTPQDYRDWQDDSYLRGLYFSYAYFFQISMPSRAHRNSIIFAGTMGLIRRSALERIGGWNSDVVTEDAEASLRMLGMGYRGVYDPTRYGRGMMPLSFDGLKKQRFRWALGGVQILRLHWRDLLPVPGLRRSLRLTAAQRVHYLLGSVQWFGDALMASFMAVLLLTGLGVGLHHRLPVRQLTGAALAIPLIFLLTGLMRAVWAMRATTSCTWGDAIRGLRIWFALSWVVSLACVTGLVRRQVAFLRTPKRRDGQRGRLASLRFAQAETLVAATGGVAAVAMLVRAPAWTTAALALLLVFQSWVYANAAWASMAAEGIKLTPARRLYLRSSRSTGEWPPAAGRGALALAAATAAALLLLVVYPLTAAGPPSQPFTNPGGPSIGQLPAPNVPHPSGSPESSARTG